MVLYTNFMNWDHPGIALITGASSGIGAEFARQLASQGFGLILLARTEANLRALATELEGEYHVRTEVLTADLSLQVDVDKVVSRLKEIDTLDILINNAGFGSSGDFADNDFSIQLNMLQVHTVAPVHLTRAVLQPMLERKRGVIINVSSVGGYLPSAGGVMYASTKAFLRMFSQSIALEVMDSEIRVQALCPGFTHTKFHEVGELEGFNKGKIPKSLWMSAEEVIAGSLKAARKNKAVYVPGFKNKILRMLINAPIIGRILQKGTRVNRVE